MERREAVNGRDGWYYRIFSKTALAAVAGAGVGVAVGVWKRQDPLRFSASFGFHATLCGSLIGGTQELVREIRATDPDDWRNCFLGGLLSGAVLGKIQGGPSRAAPAALLFAFAATGLQFGVNEWKEYRLKQYIASLPPEESAALGFKVAEKPATEVATKPTWVWPEWLPIRKLDEEAIKKRAANVNYRRQKVLKALHEGEPIPVENHKEQL